MAERVRVRMLVIDASGDEVQSVVDVFGEALSKARAAVATGQSIDTEVRRAGAIAEVAVHVDPPSDR